MQIEEILLIISLVFKTLDVISSISHSRKKEPPPIYNICIIFLEIGSYKKEENGTIIPTNDIDSVLI